MTKHTHTVIAEMVDSATGDRKFPGDGFTPHDDDQAERLIKARCLKEGTPPKAEEPAAEEPKAEDKPAAPKPAAAARAARSARA